MLAYLKHDKTTLVSGGIIAALALAAIVAPLIAPYDPLRINLDALRLPPSWEHWMGTDNKGRDVLSRVIFGARISLLVGVAASAVSLFIGVLVGTVGGYAGGKTDAMLT